MNLSEFDKYQNLQFDSLSLKKFSEFDLIINATSASLNNNVVEIPKKLLDSNPVLYDMMYGPKSNLFCLKQEMKRSLTVLVCLLSKLHSLLIFGMVFTLIQWR